MLRNVIEAHPDAWKARLELAERLESRAKEGLLAGMMRKMYESATSEASTSEPPDEGTSEESAPVIPPDMLSQLPEGLTQEQIEGLDKQAAEQRDLAARAAPKESQVYLARFNSRLGAAFFKYMFLDRMQEAPKLDKAATMKMIKDAINPSDLRKAWKYDPTNATLLRTLVFFEIANVLLDESSHTPFKELGNNILNEDPNKRTWNLISAANRGKLAGYEGGIRNAIKSHPSDVWAAYEALGLLKAFQGERKEAETAFTVAAKMTDKADLSYMVLFASRAENLSGDSSAQEGAKNVIPIWEMRVKVSGSPADMLNLAGAYAEVDQLDKAESLVRQALRLDSEDPAAHSLLGAILLKRQSDPQEAIQHLEKAISLSLSEEDWNTENARLNLGIAYALVSNMDKSREALGKVGGEGNPHTTALEILKELEVGAGHVIYCSTEYVAIGPDGTMGKTQPNNSYASTAITTFTAEAGSIVITQPEGYLTVIPPTSRIDPSDTPAADYEPGRIVVKFPDNSRRVYPEGSTMEILTAPRTFGGS
jgi:tetratricopeptide (TPR) repeat protein